jgi:arylsulfatase A-like enzyme
MSGQYGPRTGVYTVGGTDRFDTSMRPLVPVENVTKLAPEKVTVAESLKRAGYATGLFGKWHLGDDPEHHPPAQGFDEAIVSMGRSTESGDSRIVEERVLRLTGLQLVRIPRGVRNVPAIEADRMSSLAEVAAEPPECVPNGDDRPILVAPPVNQDASLTCSWECCFSPSPWAWAASFCLRESLPALIWRTGDCR